MSIPYLPLYVADYEADTAHLTPEEDGLYMRLLRLCWRTPGCSVPDDPAWIARRLRVDAETYERVVAPLIEEFLSRGKGRLFSPRLMREFERITATSEKRSAAGAKGGRPRKPLKANDPTESPAKANGKHLDLDLDKGVVVGAREREREAERPTPPSQPIATPQPEPPGTLEGIQHAAGYDPARGRMPARWYDTHLLAHLDRWRRLGLTDAEIEGVIADCRPRDGPASSPAYYDRPMAALAETKALAAQPIPFPGGHDARPSRPGRPAALTARERRVEAASDQLAAEFAVLARLDAGGRGGP